MLSFFPRDVLDEMFDLTEKVSEGFPTYFLLLLNFMLSIIISHVLYSLQVKISYDCLVGLDDSKPTTAYTINLATAFGLNVTYYFTVYGENTLFFLLSVDIYGVDQFAARQIQI